MALGVTKSIEVIQDIQLVALSVSKLFKSGGFSIFRISEILKLVADVQELVSDAQGALPELKDLDAAEVGKLTEASYSAVRNIIAALVVK